MSQKPLPVLFLFLESMRLSVTCKHSPSDRFEPFPQEIVESAPRETSFEATTFEAESVEHHDLDPQLISISEEPAHRVFCDLLDWSRSSAKRSGMRWSRHRNEEPDSSMFYTYDSKSIHPWEKQTFEWIQMMVAVPCTVFDAGLSWKANHADLMLTIDESNGKTEVNVRRLDKDITFQMERAAFLIRLEFPFNASC